MSTLPDHEIPGPGDNSPAAPGPRRRGHHAATRPGLWELKKARTRAAIREHALRLFREQGYDATTVEQIAAAAEVSPSTFFRYFPTKEDVVLQDDMELIWIEALRAQPPGMPPIAALRASLHDAFASLSAEDLAKIRETTDFALSVPAVRARMLDEFARTIQVMAAAIAERTGRNPDDFGVRTLVGAALGVAMSSWFTAQGDVERFMTEYARALELLLTGLPLE
jgi:AcrR family transcriptional regulator